MHEVLVNCLFKLVQEKSVVRSTDRPAMTIAVDLGRKASKQTKQTECLRTIYLCKGGEETLLVQMTELRKAELTVFKGGDLENKITLKVRSRTLKSYQLFIFAT